MKYIVISDVVRAASTYTVAQWAYDKGKLSYDELERLRNAWIDATLNEDELLTKEEE